MIANYSLSPIPMPYHEVPAINGQRTSFKEQVIAIITSGSGRIQIDRNEYPLSEGSIITLFPSHTAQITEASNDLCCLYLSFSFDFMADFPYMLQAHIAEQMEATPYIQSEEKEYMLLRSVFQPMASHFNQKEHPSYLAILRSYIFIFVAEVSNIYTHKGLKTTSGHYEKMTDQFFSLLHDHFRTQRSVSFYADQMCITYKHLSRIIREITGATPSQWIAHFTLKEAKSLLRSTDKSITQIAEELQFGNSSSFAAFFRKHTGLSPLEFRQ